MEIIEIINKIVKIICMIMFVKCLWELEVHNSAKSGIYAILYAVIGFC